MSEHERLRAENERLGADNEWLRLANGGHVTLQKRLKAALAIAEEGLRTINQQSYSYDSSCAGCTDLAGVIEGVRHHAADIFARIRDAREEKS